MNAYFFKMNKEEKESILDKHKQVYDGYVTQYIKPNTHPLFVQSYANDKNGITVNNRGEVGQYRNTNINEDIFSGAKFEPEETFEDMYVSSGLKKDMIADREDHMEHGTFDEDGDKLFKVCVACRGMGFDDITGMDCDKCHGSGCGDFSYDEDVEEEDMNEPEIFDFEVEDSDEMDNIKIDLEKLRTAGADLPELLSCEGNGNKKK